MKAEGRFVGRLRSTARADISIPQPVIAEIAYGIERLPKSRRRDALAGRFELLRAELARAPWTDMVSERFGAVKAELARRGARIEDFDVAVAAHALAEGAVLVTANLEHMARVPGLTVEDWTA
jgi:tRNA(fMet)-specific endonuclease VapC